MARSRSETDVYEIDTDRVPLQGETEAFNGLVAELKRRYPPQVSLDLA
jgi:hypothetical protein